jgi:protein-S-isoprenylcysteine O-methyltransferase Ste14
MNGIGWWYRLCAASLFVVMILVAVGLGWAKPSWFVYVATVFVGVLIWLDFERHRRARNPGAHADPDETTVPDVHGHGSAAR